jgi:heme-degrading monooxygenase HmoA
MQSTIALVRHRVADFDAWKTIYDTYAPIQAEHGVRAHQVLRSLEDRSEVTIAHTFDSVDDAKAFFAMPELKTAMTEAGVKSDSVSVMYYDEIEAGALIAV